MPADNVLQADIFTIPDPLGPLGDKFLWQGDDCLQANVFTIPDPLGPLGDTFLWQGDDCLQADIFTIPDPLGPLGDNFLWQGDDCLFEPWFWNSAADDLKVDTGLMADVGHVEPQQPNPVSVKRYLETRPSDIATPGLVYASSIDSSDRQGGYLDHSRNPVTANEFSSLDIWTKPSTPPNLEYQQDDWVGNLACTECGLAFENLQGLDKHTKISSHKAWRCQAPDCGKSYRRRDTFLRHCKKHKDNAHVCNVCSSSGRHKLFKRKDHLKEHMRNCHPHSLDDTRSNSHISSFDKLAKNPKSTRECRISAAPSESESCISERQEAMKDLVKSLRTLLSNRSPNLVGMLERKMTALSSSDMSLVAETMVDAALAAKS